MIKASSYIFCIVILFGLGLSVLAGFVLASPPTADGGCVARVWLCALSVMLVLSALFAKTYRLHALFNDTEIRHSEGLSNTDLFKFVGVLLLLMSAVLIAWMVVDKPAYTEEIDTALSTPSLVVLNVYCSTRYEFVLTIALMYAVILIWGSYISWKIRLLPSQFNESSQIALCIALVLFIGIIAVPVNFLVSPSSSSSSNDAVLIIRGLGYILPTIAITLILFIPKVHLVFNTRLQDALARANPPKGIPGGIRGGNNNSAHNSQLSAKGSNNNNSLNNNSNGNSNNSSSHNSSNGVEDGANYYNNNNNNVNASPFLYSIGSDLSFSKSQLGGSKTNLSKTKAATQESLRNSVSLSLSLSSEPTDSVRSSFTSTASEQRTLLKPSASDTSYERHEAIPMVVLSSDEK